MEYSPSHPTEDYSPSRPTDTPSPPSHTMPSNQSSGTTNVAMAMSSAGGVTEQGSEKLLDKVEEEDISNRISKKKSKKKSKHADRSVSRSPSRKKNETPQDTVQDSKVKDSFSWDSDEDLDPVITDSRKKSLSRSRSPASMDGKHNQKITKSEKHFSSPKHRKQSQSRSRSRSLDRRSGKASGSPKIRRSRSKSHSRSQDSGRDSYRKSDIKSRSSSRYKSRSRSRSLSKDSYSRKDNHGRKTSRNRSRSESADSYEERGRKLKSSKRYSSRISNSRSRTRSRSKDSGREKYFKKSSPKNRKKSLSPNYRRTSSNSRSRSCSVGKKNKKKKKAKKIYKDSYSSSPSRSGSFDSTRKHEQKNRSVSPKYQRSEKKKERYRYSSDRSRSASPVHTKSDRMKRSLDRLSKSPYSHRGEEKHTRRKNSSPYRRKYSSSPDYNRKSAHRKTNYRRSSISPYQSDEGRKKSDRSKDKSPNRDSPLRDLSKDSKLNSPKQNQESSSQEEIPREKSPDTMQDSRAPVSFKMNIIKPVKRDLPIFVNDFDDLHGKDEDEKNKENEIETKESLVQEENVVEEGLRKVSEASVSSPPTRISTHSPDIPPKRRTSRSRSRSVDSNDHHRLSKKAKKAAKKAKKKVKKQAKERNRLERNEIESSNSSFNISTESLGVEEHSQDKVKEAQTVELNSNQGNKECRVSSSSEKEPRSPEGRKLSRRHRISDSHQTPSDEGAGKEKESISVDVNTIPLPGQEMVTEADKDAPVSKSCVEQKKPEETMPVFTDLSSIPMPGEQPVSVEKTGTAEKDILSTRTPDEQSNHSEPIDSNDGFKVSDDLVSEQKLEQSELSEVKESEESKQSPKPSSASEEKIKRELKKLNIDMVKSVFDFEGDQSRRRSRRSCQSIEKDSESESQDSARRTTRRNSKASVNAEDSTESENSQTDSIQSSSETEKSNAEVVKESPETPVTPVVKSGRKRKSRFTDISDSDQVLLAEKKTETATIEMSPDPSTLPKVSVTLEPINLGKTGLKTPIKFALSNGTQVISKVKWDEEEDDSDKKKETLSKFIPEDDDKWSIAKGDKKLIPGHTDSIEQKNEASVQFDVTASVIGTVTPNPSVSLEHSEEMEKKKLETKESKKSRFDIFETALRKAKELVDNGMIGGAEESKKKALDVPTGEDNIETVDMECDSNSNSQDALIFQENDNAQNSRPASSITTFPTFPQVYSAETMIPDFGMPLKEGVSSPERKPNPPVNIPLPPPNPLLPVRFPVPPPQPVVPPFRQSIPAQLPPQIPLPTYPPPGIPANSTTFSSSIPLPPKNILSPQSTSGVLPPDIPLPPPPSEKSTFKVNSKDSSSSIPPPPAAVYLPSDHPISTVAVINPPEPLKPDVPVSGISEMIPLPSERIPLPSEPKHSTVLDDNQSTTVTKLENQGNLPQEQQTLSNQDSALSSDVANESTQYSPQNGQPTEVPGKAQTKESLRSEAELPNVGEADIDSVSNVKETAEVPLKSSIELSKQALLAKVSAKKKDGLNTKEKKITIGRISYAPFSERSTEKSRDDSEANPLVKKMPMIKIGPIVMNKGKDLDTMVGESSEDGEIRSESENESLARHRAVESHQNIPISPLVTEKQYEHSNPAPSGFGMLPKKDAPLPMWSSENLAPELHTNPVTSASESDDSRLDDREYYKKVDEFLKKVEKPKTTVERKFDEFLEKVRKPKADSPSLEEKVDEFLKKTEKKDSRGSSYDEYKSSKHERDDHDKYRERDTKDRDHKDREHRERDRERDRDHRDRDNRDRDNRDRDRKRRERDREYDDRHRDREYDERHRDREYEDRHRDRDREYEDRHRDREYEDRHRDRDYEDRHRKRERRGSRERSRSRERYRDKGRERSRERSRSRSRSRSRDRERRHSEKRAKRSRHERDDRRRRDSSDEDRSPRPRSRRTKSDRGEEKEKKNLTEEWLKLESQLAAKKKMLAEAGVSIGGTPSQAPPSAAVVQPAATEYYHDAYGNYYPVPANQANASSAYPSYPQYPALDPNTGYPVPPQPPVYTHESYPPLQQAPPPTPHAYNVPNTPVYNTQGQPIQQDVVYGREPAGLPPVQPTPRSAVPRAAVVYGQVPTQPSILSAISSPAVIPPTTLQSSLPHVNTSVYPGQPQSMVPNIASSQMHVQVITVCTSLFIIKLRYRQNIDEILVILKFSAR